MLLVCCPVCGSRRVDFSGSLVLGGCPDFHCPDCGASGFLSGRLSDDDAELVVCEVPGREWCLEWCVLRRPLFDCAVPFVMPDDDADRVWSSPGSRWWSVFAPSGVQVGWCFLDGHGVWCCRSLIDNESYGMLFESSDDLREWIAGGACGVVPVGSFVGTD